MADVSLGEIADYEARAEAYALEQQGRTKEAAKIITQRANESFRPTKFRRIKMGLPILQRKHKRKFVTQPRIFRYHRPALTKSGRTRLRLQKFAAGAKAKAKSFIEKCKEIIKPARKKISTAIKTRKIIKRAKRVTFRAIKYKRKTFKPRKVATRSNKSRLKNRVRMNRFPTFDFPKAAFATISASLLFNVFGAAADTDGNRAAPAPDPSPSPQPQPQPQPGPSPSPQPQPQPAPTKISTGNTTYDQFDNLILQSATYWGLDPLVIKAIIAQESSFIPTAQGNAPCPPYTVKSTGLMQISSNCTPSLDPNRLTDPAYNIQSGAGIYRNNIDQIRAKFPAISQSNTPTTDVYATAIAAYNGGMGVVTNYNSWTTTPDPQYFQHVLNWYKTFLTMIGNYQGGVFNGTEVYPK